MASKHKEAKMGRPPMYDADKKVDVNKMERRLKQYFADQDEKARPYTVTGIAMALKFGAKSSLYDYSDKDTVLSYMIKCALLRVENQHEESLSTRQSCTGNIFALKNMGWSDKHEIDTNIRGDIIIVTGVPEPDED